MAYKSCQVGEGTFFQAVSLTATYISYRVDLLYEFEEEVPF